MEQNYSAIDRAFAKLETELNEEKYGSYSYYEMQDSIHGTGKVILEREGISDKQD